MISKRVALCLHVVCGRVVPFPYICSYYVLNLSHLSLRRQNVIIKSLGFRCAKNEPHVSHLFFVDDSLIFTQANDNDALAVIEVLNRYEWATLQR